MINTERKELIKNLQTLVLDKKGEGTHVMDKKIQGNRHHEKKTSRQSSLYAIKILAK
jgi:hypothetical protein